ncbi:superoxide dismutase family protein [Aeoliella sp. SH292]|uniref:superoxide dismutase family protein n=1 Tax=Aeoliella sp. SH292 TaxID=3454464 RepID=UPI003F9AC452
MLRSFALLAALGLVLGCEKADAPMDGTMGTGSDGTATAEPITAVCNLEEIGGSGVTGTLNFVQEADTVTLTGEVTGLTPGLHGFHVHESGDLSDKEKGESAGGHFNPTGHAHGHAEDAERHVGDLGNIEANAEGVATINITDTVIRLDGEHPIVGKAMVVHADEDKFTQPTGDAGGRVAFGVVELQEFQE